MRSQKLRAAWLALALASAGIMPSTSYGQIALTPREPESGGLFLTLAQALAQALANHPDLRVGEAELGSAEALTRQAGALPNPELAALMEDTRAETRATTVQLSQPIELGGKRTARVQAAQWAQQQAALDLAMNKAGVEARLRQAFYSLAVAQERVRLDAELMGLASRAQDAADKRVAAGKVPPIEAVKAGVAVSQARAALACAQGEERAARQRLAQALGLPHLSTTMRVQVPLAPLPALSRWDDLAAIVDSGPAVQRARLEVSRRQALADLERARATPDLTVTAGVKRDAQLKRHQPIVGVTLSLPLFDRNQGAYDAAVRQVSKSDAELSAMTSSVLAQAFEALEQLRAATAQYRALRDDILPGAQQALDVATKGYEQGKFSFLDVLDAQRTYFEAQNQSLTSAEAAFRADARLIELLGTNPAPQR